MLTFRQLQLEVLRWLDEADDTDTTLALVKDGLNRSHRRLIGSRTWPFMLWPREESFTTVAGTRAYALKPNVGKLLTLYDYTFNLPCPLVSRREWEAAGVDRTGTQTVPQGAIYGDVWPVSAQPASVTVSVVSSSASDTSGPTLVLEGLNSSGEATTETLTLTGTTPVVSSTTWLHLWKVSKTGTWVGTMTLSASAATILSLTASEYGKQYPTLEFIETPALARTYYYTAQRNPGTLSNDYDIPDTPYPYSEIHVYDCLLDLTTYNTELGAKEQRLWKERYDALMQGLLQSVDEGIAGSRPRYVRNMNARVVSRISTTA
jgi:hypothetical protein